VVIALMGSTNVEEARAVFERAHIPTYPFPERAAFALRALLTRAELLTAETQRHGDLKSSPWLPDSVATFSPEELVTAYGIKTAPLTLAGSLQEAIVCADTIGYPLVMKIASPDILHKSDVGGVALNIQDADSLCNAYAQMIGRVREKAPEAQIEGVHIQRQIAEGQDVIAGAVRDPQFGPLMMFGSGGVEVEGLKDVAFALAPLTRKEAESMVRKTWAGKKLKAFAVSRRLTRNRSSTY
jgi:acetyltransferase